MIKFNCGSFALQAIPSMWLSAYENVCTGMEVNPSTCLYNIYLFRAAKCDIKYGNFQKFFLPRVMLYNKTPQSQKCNIKICLYLKYLGFLQVNSNGIIEFATFFP